MFSINALVFIITNYKLLITLVSIALLVTRMFNAMNAYPIPVRTIIIFHFIVHPSVISIYFQSISCEPHPYM